MKYRGAEGLANENGGATSDMMGMGVGMAMGHQMGKSMIKTCTRPDLSSDEEQYFVAIDGNSEGPYTLEVIEEYINSGKINKKSRMWKEGMQEWDEAAKVMSELFSKIPPPLK
jgi:hypothetical protein